MKNYYDDFLIFADKALEDRVPKQQRWLITSNIEGAFKDGNKNFVFSVLASFEKTMMHKLKKGDPLLENVQQEIKTIKVLYENTLTKQEEGSSIFKMEI